MKVEDLIESHLLEPKDLKPSVVEVLAYFSIFRFPLTATEIHNCLRVKCDLDSVKGVLDELYEDGKILVQQPYFSLHSDPLDQMISERQQDEDLFNRTILKVNANSRLIARFPFVKSVSISGSVSKGVMKEDGDIDFFIITQSDRLWLCRTFLILYKKIYRLNSRKYFCVNYFIAENELEIPDQNIFTATEISYLVPTFNIHLHAAFLKENSWTENYLPNFIRPISFDIQDVRKRWIVRLIQWVLKGKFGESMDRYCQKISIRRWKRKFPDFDQKEMELAMRSRRTVSKHHPRNFQKKVLHLLKKKKEEIKSFENGSI